MGEESYPEGLYVETFASDWERGDGVVDAMQLMERRLGTLVPTGRNVPRQIVVENGESRRETLRERLEREREEAMTAIAYLTTRVAKREAQLRELSRYPETDPYKDGDALQFDKTYPGDQPRTYTFMALRAADLWYVTGSKGPQGVPWAKLTEWMGIGVTNIRKIGATRNTPVRW